MVEHIDLVIVILKQYNESTKNPVDNIEKLGGDYVKWAKHFTKVLQAN